jgi:diacylglycerol kinase (ATP)
LYNAINDKQIRTQYHYYKDNLFLREIMSAFLKAIVFYNTKSGQSKVEKHREKIRSHFRDRQVDVSIIEVPKPLDELDALVSQAVNENVDLFIAAGGDGTASLIGNALIGTGKPMGILPLGTGNLLAKELKIPQDLVKALELITDQDPKTVEIDTIIHDGRHYLLNLSAGVTPTVMGGTEAEEKKRFGLFAYFVHFVEQLLGLKLHRFEIQIDGRTFSYNASEILITNTRATGLEPLEWADHVAVNDGVLDMFVVRAANIFDIIGIILSVFTKQHHRNPVIKTYQIKEHCRISTQSPLPTQADGDPLGETPVEIQVDPGSLSIIAGNKFIQK